VDFTIALGDLPPDKVDVVKDIYADSLAYVDAQIGRLLDHLEETGQGERTILVVTADTGQAFYEHGFAGHGRDLYDEIMHVPLILRAPGLRPGADDRLAQHVDVPPTVFGLLGIPPYPGFQGRDLLAAGDEPRSAYLLCQSPLAEQYGIVREGWKLIHDLRKRRLILYDLESDPEEKRDRSAVHPEVVEDLRGRLHAWVRHQLDYYDDEGRQSGEFPPVLED
jgi:arylsulfatase A-like enzyme